MNMGQCFRVLLRWQWDDRDHLIQPAHVTNTETETFGWDDLQKTELATGKAGCDI